MYRPALKSGSSSGIVLYRVVLEKALASVNALRATRPVHERYAPNLRETQALLQAVKNQGGYPTNLIARLLYGCGLRVSEPLNLQRVPQLRINISGVRERIACPQER